MTPDRLTRTVKRFTFPHATLHENITALLTQESAYQRRQLRAMVKQKRMLAGIRTAYKRDRETKGNVISAYTLACDDILTALGRRRKP